MVVVAVTISVLGGIWLNKPAIDAAVNKEAAPTVAQKEAEERAEKTAAEAGAGSTQEKAREGKLASEPLLSSSGSLKSFVELLLEPEPEPEPKSAPAAEPNEQERKSIEGGENTSIFNDLAFIEQAGPLVVFALSGMGKTTLTKNHPNLVYDTDRALDEATSEVWPEMDPYDRRRAWRRFCREKPWQDPSKGLVTWGRIRKRYIETVQKVLNYDHDVLVLISEFTFPWAPALHVGVKLGQYQEHLNIVGKISDNGQDESMNNRLEGYAPLMRIDPGDHLSDVPVIDHWIKRRL